MMRPLHADGIMQATDTHSKGMGYLLWIFGFFGAHRFYYGLPVSGTIYFFTGGLCFFGWLIDLFLIPGMERSAEHTYVAGRINYNLAWIALTFGGLFGIHRFYLGRYLSGLLFLFTGGLLGIGYLWDYWHLNEMISAENSARG